MARYLRLVLIGSLALAMLAALGAAPSPLAADDHAPSLGSAFRWPVATMDLRDRPPHGPATGDNGRAASAAAACDKDVDLTSTSAGVVSIAAQDNVICTSADVDVYENAGQQYVVQAGGEDAAFTITRIAADGIPTMVTQKIWIDPATGRQAKSRTQDVKAFKQGSNRYIALSIEAERSSTFCGVAILDVTNAEDGGNPTPGVRVTGAAWCSVHNSFVESISGDGRYLYLTDPSDMRVLDIGDLSNISEIGRYTPSGTGSVHDMTVIDHGGSVGRRAYLAYGVDPGVMILNAAHVTPGVIQPGSPNQALNPENSINPPRFIPHHAFPTADGTRLFIEDELFADPGDEPVQMWDISDPANPSYVDGIAVGGALMPVVNFAHNLELRYDLDLDGDGSPDNRLYVGWYKAGLQAFDFDSSGFIERRMYHQLQTEQQDDEYDGAWGVRLATIGSNTYIFQSDRRYGLIIDKVDVCSALVNPGQPDTDGDGVINLCDPDDDGDGWSDDVEVYITTDPLNAGPPGGAPPDPTPAPDGDGQTMIDDIFFAAGRFNQATDDVNYTPRAEIASQDGIIGIDDVFGFASRFGQTYP